MFHRWLDHWEEQRAQRGDEGKSPTDFALDPELAFPDSENIEGILSFSALADEAVNDPAFFDEPDGYDAEVRIRDGWVSFRSSVTTNIEANNVVWAKITPSSSLEHVLVVFHHWNARSRNGKIATFLARRGITVVEIAMPYHFERTRPGSLHADYMLNANLGRTIQSVRQAVLDGRTLIRWFKGEGYGKVSVLGMSLGSWVAGLAAAHDPAVAKASLFLTGGSLADMVWTGRATRAIRQSIEPHIGLSDLNRAWSPLNLENYAKELARPGLDLQIVLGTRDTVVRPDVSERLVERLTKAGASPEVLKLNCGHYSLALPPFILFAGFRLARMLNR